MCTPLKKKNPPVPKTLHLKEKQHLLLALLTRAVRQTAIVTSSDRCRCKGPAQVPPTEASFQYPPEVARRAFFRKANRPRQENICRGPNEGRAVDMQPRLGEQLAPVEPRLTSQWQLYVRGGVKGEC